MRACWGGRAATTKLLLEAGAKPNRQRSGKGQTALHFAAKQGAADCVRLLIQHGAKVDTVAHGKDTALDYTEFYRDEQVVRLLREAASPT